jgi:hypothetical protein
VIEDEGEELEREPEPEDDGLEDSGSMRFPIDDNSPVADGIFNVLLTVAGLQNGSSVPGCAGSREHPSFLLGCDWETCLDINSCSEVFLREAIVSCE